MIIQYFGYTVCACVAFIASFIALKYIIDDDEIMLKICIGIFWVIIAAIISLEIGVVLYSFH